MNYKKVCKTMYDFQCRNNIKNECTTNTTIMYDYLKSCGMKDVKIKPIIVIGFRNKIPIIVRGHVVITLNDNDDDLIECSYDVSTIEDAKYIDTLKKLFNVIPNISPDDKKLIIEDVLQFQKIANDINNGTFHISSNTVYNEQLDFIEKKCNMRFISKQK